MKLLPRKPFAAVLLGVLMFLAIGLVAKGVLVPFGTAKPWLDQAVIKTLLVVGSLGLAGAEAISFAELGFRRPVRTIVGKALGAGLLLGVCATLAVLLSGSRGLGGMLKGYSFGAMVLWVWVVSSVSEEVFCRGWFQASLQRAAPTNAQLLWPSAVLFGGMHLTLLFKGIDLRAVAILVAATTMLGFVTARARAVSESLYPAIAAHVAFNIGGMLGGVIYAIGFSLTTGQLPPQLSQ